MDFLNTEACLLLTLSCLLGQFLLPPFIGATEQFGTFSNLALQVQKGQQMFAKFPIWCLFKGKIISKGSPGWASTAKSQSRVFMKVL